MKSKIFLIGLLLASHVIFAQWPVNNGIQGNITGTIGEVRGNATRIHNGTDIDWSPENIYTIQSDSIIWIDHSTAFNKFIRMFSRITYTHVTPINSIVRNNNEADEVNAGIRRIPRLALNQRFAIMIPTSAPQHYSHVHMTNLNNASFLTNGFGVSGFTFLDNVIPKIGIDGDADGIRIYKDKNAGRQAARFTTFVEDEGYPANAKPLRVWGPIDAVANAYQDWINPSGNTLNQGHLAPYQLGYSLINSKTNAVEFEDFNRLRFDFGLAGGVDITNSAIIDSIHAKGSSPTNPLFVVTNQYLNTTPKDGNVNTGAYEDGDYKINIKVEGSKGTSGTSLIKERAINLRFDNFKTYIKKVSVKDANSTVKYFAEWSAISRGSDGTINLLEMNSEAFKSGQTVTLEVTTSEFLPNLNLTMINLPAIPLTSVGTTGTEWTASFTLPSSANRKVQLIFQSDNRLFGLVLNQDVANIKRNAVGDYSVTNSKDKNHELRVCPETYDLSLAVSAPQGQVATLVATGGTPPYLYSIDATPVSPHNHSTFTSNNVYTIDFDRNYLFKVKDNGGCQSERYYTLPRIQCNQTTFAGNQGTDIKRVDLGSVAGTARIRYDMYSIPDEMIVTYRGTNQTTGIISGQGFLDVVHFPGASNLVTITMNAPNSGTAWEYTVFCPGSQIARQSSSEPKLEYTLKYNSDVVSILPLNKNNSDFYNINYKIVGNGSWQKIENAKLPFNIKNKEKEIQLKLEPSLLSNDQSLFKVFPNPSTGPLQIQYVSNKAEEITMSIYDIESRILDSKKIEVIKGMNLIEWKPVINGDGIYLLKLNTTENTKTQSVYITH